MIATEYQHGNKAAEAIKYHTAKSQSQYTLHTQLACLSPRTLRLLLISANSTAKVWPPDLLGTIQSIISAPCPAPTKPTFHFDMSRDAERNFCILVHHKFDLAIALAAQPNSPMSYGSEFRSPEDLLMYGFQ